jgi:penicillin-binding protein 2
MLKLFRRNKKRKIAEITPEDIFIDSANVPDFNRNQMEGRIEKAISERNIIILGIFFVILGLFLGGRAYLLQIAHGADYAKQSANNHLRNDFLFADRGLIKDRNGVLLAWNVPNTDIHDFSLRSYIDEAGFGNLLGFVKYPAKDKSGFFYKTDLSGADGVEKYFNDLLAGQNGLKIVETDATGNIQSQSTIRPPEQGKVLTLSIDAQVQEDLYNSLKQTVDTSGFTGGGGIIMDAHTGEVLAVATYPEYSSQVMTDGSDVDTINGYFQNKDNPFLDRAISGLYAPGSIIKPFIAIGALNDNIISPDKQIESKGFISIPNPYSPSHPSIFKDWKANGWTNIQQALAVSSDVYFYVVGGGYGDQKGLGITGIDKYVQMFGFGQSVNNSFFSIKNNGVIPTPAWKAQVFNGDPWRLGDTYHTSIGQFGFQITPVQDVRALSALVTDGTPVDPVIVKKGTDGYNYPVTKTLSGIQQQNYEIVKGGMRLAVTDGTLGALKFPDLSIAGKTGTAEVGSLKDYVNSWVTGFFPYDNPKYVFALVLEKGPSVYAEGAPAAMRRVFETMMAATSTVQYLK